MIMNICSFTEDQIQAAFFCPITRQVMVDPLMSRYGQSYEHDAIITWIEKYGKECPLTRQRITISDLISNRALKSQIHVWFSSRGLSHVLYGDAAKDGVNSAVSSKENTTRKILLTCTIESLNQDSCKDTPLKAKQDKLEVPIGNILRRICNRCRNAEKLFA